MRKFVVAPDKFKGSLTADEVAQHLIAGIRSAAPDAIAEHVPIADGGEGTINAAVHAGFERIAVRATGPTGLSVATSYGRRGDIAVIELADICGQVRLPGGRHAPMTASSRGLGEVAVAALDAGCRRLVLGVGGSASTDGGVGFLQALGADVLDAAGAPVGPGGAALLDIAAVDLTRLHPAVHEAEITIACDVDNPLLGKQGAAAVYGPQKGASAQQVRTLQAGLSHWASIVTSTIGGTTDAPGAGAAGGVGFAALAVLQARFRFGVDVVLELTDFDAALDGATLVVTGEGALDSQSMRGKAPMGIARAAQQQGKPVIAVVGRSALRDEEAARMGFVAVHSLLDEAGGDIEKAMGQAGPLLERIGRRLVAESPSGMAPVSEAAQ